MKKLSLQELDRLQRVRMLQYQQDWCLFAREALGARLDPEQQAILRSVQHQKMTSVASGTARGKDFIAAVACICFLYLTPRFQGRELTQNTKVAMTAPTDRQVKNIMLPEISRLFYRARKNGVNLPGRITGYDIRTDYEEWFLTGFKADEHNHEAWSGFHAANTMFVVTEASGLPEEVFNAIEGNLQGNSRILIVFNPNRSVGYAARSQKSPRWSRFQLNSLNALNVRAKQQLIPGQVDYEWVEDKVQTWCTPIQEQERLLEENDFEWQGRWYRPSDLFRVKVLGVFPKVSEDSLIPMAWVEAAQQRWRERYETPGAINQIYDEPLLLGSDVAGMGRDATVEVYRYGRVVEKILVHHSGGKADHMETAGRLLHQLQRSSRATVLVDTIGEGAGVYSRLVEQGYADRVVSVKYSAAARDSGDRELTDSSGQYRFANKRAWLFWQVREWLDPKNGHQPLLPPSDEFLEEATEIKWSFQSSGKIIIEPKDDIKKRLKRSTDTFDALANTFDIVDISTLSGQNLNLLSNIL